MNLVGLILAQPVFKGLDVVCTASPVSALRLSVLRLPFLQSSMNLSNRWMETGHTLSGSSPLIFRPGLTRSGKIHSLLGLAKTLPDEEDVSLPEMVDRLACCTVERLDGPDADLKGVDGVGREVGLARSGGRG